MAHYGLYRPWPSGSWGSGLDDLRREMDALFSRYGTTGGRTASGWGGVFPAVNLYETGEAYVLTAELPGVDPGDIHVSIEGSTVLLHGERKIEYPTREGTSLHRRERQTGSFRRAFELPIAVDAEHVEAVHRNGVLLLRLPKAPEHRPRQVTVQAG